MENAPKGVRFEQTENGFRLRASCLSFSNTVMRVGLAGVVSSLPFVLWWDLIRGLWTYEGANFWFACAFLAVWAAAIAYADLVALMSLFGEIRITQAGRQGEIFTGIGPLGWTHRFSWDEFQDVSELETQLGDSGRKSTARYLVLNAPSKRYRFGWPLPVDGRAFIVTALRKHVFAINASTANRFSV